MDQVVVQPVILVRDEGRQVQISFVRAAPGELKDLSFAECRNACRASERARPEAAPAQGEACGTLRRQGG
ncbi:MAG TPA: hypothetical protein VMV25_12300 [Steroidobacteraceae bacterium]|nr:hypothetical protein [Steroidobacteraceae bacterium]